MGSSGAAIAKYRDTIKSKSGVKPKEIDRLWGAIDSTDTRRNPYISDDDLWANKTRLNALAGQEDPPGVRTNEVDRVYDAIKKTDTIKNPLISDEDILANLNRLEALGGSWGKEDERKKKQKYFDIADIPNRSPDDIRRIMGGEMYDKYLAENGKTDTDLRSEYLDRYRELLGGQSGSMKRDAVTQMITQDILDWDAEQRMGENGNNTVEKRTATGYNGSNIGQSSGKSDHYVYDPMHWETEFRSNIERKIGWLSPDLNEKSRTRMVNAIILAEAEELQQKYRAVYYGSNNILSSIFSPGLHKTLVPLFTEYPTKETETNPIFEAAADGLSTGFSAGLWSEASKGIYHEGAGEAKLPTNDSQLKHIFREADGHLLDTPANRSLLERTANNPQNFIGGDIHGTQWYAQIQPDGSQVWVRTYNGTITNAGLNTTPKVFDPQTGLNYNPFK